MSPRQEIEIDARGLRCPLPVLRLRKVLAAARPGTVVHIRTDDPMAAVDIPHFCHENGLRLLASGETGGDRTHSVEKPA